MSRGKRRREAAAAEGSTADARPQGSPSARPNASPKLSPLVAPAQLRQSPKFAPLGAPAQSLRPSPKVSALAAPELPARDTGSPKLSPLLAEALGLVKASNGKKMLRPVVSEAEKEEATKKAIAMIEQGLRDNHDAQIGGQPFIPSAWALEMKPVLGPYKKFVENCSHFRIESGDQPSQYTVHIREGATLPASESQRPSWQKDLLKAWQGYCQTSPDSAGHPGAFAQEAWTVAGGVGLLTALGNRSNEDSHARVQAKRKDEGAPPARPKKKKRRL